MLREGEREGEREEEGEILRLGINHPPSTPRILPVKNLRASFPAGDSLHLLLRANQRYIPCNHHGPPDGMTSYLAANRCSF